MKFYQFGNKINISHINLPLKSKGNQFGEQITGLQPISGNPASCLMTSRVGAMLKFIQLRWFGLFVTCGVVM